jgi:hypothetical protein
MDRKLVTAAIHEAARTLHDLSENPKNDALSDIEVAGRALEILFGAADIIRKRAREGTRVEVRDGTGANVLGLGTLVDHVMVYVKPGEKGDLSLQSLRFAEQPFDGALPMGENPKILMDDGTFRYGCQVWWQPVQEATRAEN